MKTQRGLERAEANHVHPKKNTHQLLSADTVSLGGAADSHFEVVLQVILSSGAHIHIKNAKCEPVNSTFSLSLKGPRTHFLRHLFPAGDSEASARRLPV